MNLAKIQTTLPAGYSNPADDPHFQNEVLPGQTDSAALYKLNSTAKVVSNDPTDQTDNFHKLVEMHRQARNNRAPANGSFPLHTPRMFIHTNIVKEREFLTQQRPRNVRRDGAAFIYQLTNGEYYVSYCPPEDCQFVPGP